MVRFQCERCGRHYAVSEAMRGRSFRLRCRACGEAIVVRPETVPGENPFLVDPVTASSASAAAPVEAVTVEAGAGGPAPSPRAAGPATASPADSGLEPPPAPRPAAPPGGPAAGEIPVLSRATGRAAEFPIQTDWFAGEVLEAAGADLARDGERARRNSPAVEELRQALAEALEEAPGGDGARAGPEETLHGQPGAGRAGAGSPAEAGPEAAAREERAVASPPDRTAPGEAGGADRVEEGSDATARAGAGRGAARDASGGSDAPGATPSSPLFRAAVRPARGPVAAIAVAAVAVVAIAAGVLLSRREDLPVRPGAPRTSPPAAEIAVPPAPAPAAEAAPSGPPAAAPAGEAPEAAPPPAPPPSTIAATSTASPPATAPVRPPGDGKAPATPAGTAAAAPTSAPARASRPPAAALRRTPPTPEEVARAVAGAREAFDACFAAAPPVAAGARAPSLLATVEPSGEVTLPTLDDVQLARSPLGDCVKAAARRMTFAPFDGKPARIEASLAPPAPR